MEIANTSPLVIGTYPNQRKLKRRFLGNFFPKNTFENNELKAYIKGHSQFSYKLDAFGNPAYYKVRQEYYYE